MAKNILYCDNYEIAREYKYLALIYESASSYSKLYASNNLRDIKSFVYSQVRQLYSDARGNIYYSSDIFYEDTIYMCWNEGCKTYAQNQYRR